MFCWFRVKKRHKKTLILIGIVFPVTWIITLDVESEKKILQKTKDMHSFTFMRTSKIGP